MPLKLRITTSDLAERLRDRAFLRVKALRQQLRPRSGIPQSVFVSGVQRSGTNMLMDILEASYETDVFHETDVRAFDDYAMREETVIESLIAQSNAPVVVVKALLEAHRVTGLMEHFAPAKALWMIRSFEDSVNSTVKRWPGNRNDIDRIVDDRDAGDWRGLGMTLETQEIVRKHYNPQMNDASANALFWYYRNQLYFDQRLDTEPRVLPVNYEELVSHPDLFVDSIATFLGIKATDRMRRVSHTESVRKSPAPDIAPDVHELCEAMQRRLDQAVKAQRVALGAG